MNQTSSLQQLHASLSFYHNLWGSVGMCVCVVACGSLREKIVLMNVQAGTQCVCADDQLCVWLQVSQCMYTISQKNHVSPEKAGPLLLTSFIGRGGHLRGQRSEGTSQACCQAWRAGRPHRVFTAPSKGTLTLAPVSLPCLVQKGRCGSGWPYGSSVHLPGAFQQHKEQQQRLSGLGSLKGEAMVGRRGRGRAFQGSTQPQPIYSPKRRQRGRGWTEGWIGMPVEKKKKHIFYNCRAVAGG